MAKQTARAKQCKRISRKRAQRKKRQWLGQCFSLSVRTVGLIALVGVSYWGWQSGEIVRLHRAAWQKTADAGFSLRQVYLSGHEKVTREEVLRKVPFENGQPIMQLSLDEIKTELEEIPRILRVEVSRSLPDSLHIRIIERQPVALWQHKGKVVPVDSEGTVLSEVVDASSRPLPIIVGVEANQRIQELLELLSTAPNLLTRLDAAIWVNHRRWDIQLKNGIRIKLPEEHPNLAWHKMSELHTEHTLLDQNIRTIDMRLPDRLFVTPAVAPEQEAEQT